MTLNTRQLLRQIFGMPKLMKFLEKTSIFAVRKMGVFSIYAVDYLVMKHAEENIRTVRGSRPFREAPHHIQGNVCLHS